MAKAWQSRPRRGSAVDLPAVRALAQGSDPGTQPVVSRGGERRLVHYRRSRLYLDRGAWEALLSPQDVLVQRICPADGPAVTIALTREELERVFGEVRTTRSWEDVRCTHFPVLPPAVGAFRVG
jgi:hypothetical protein